MNKNGEWVYVYSNESYRLLFSLGDCCLIGSRTSADLKKKFNIKSLRLLQKGKFYCLELWHFWATKNAIYYFCIISQGFKL